MGIVIFSVIKLRLSHYLLLHLTLLVAELDYQPPSVAIISLLRYDVFYAS